MLKNCNEDLAEEFLDVGSPANGSNLGALTKLCTHTHNSSGSLRSQKQTGELLAVLLQQQLQRYTQCLQLLILCYHAMLTFAVTDSYVGFT